MKELLYNKRKTYLHKKVTVNQAVKILKRNGIQTTEDQANLILNFLYLLASAYRDIDNEKDYDNRPGEIRTPECLFKRFKQTF
jgi:hypothetical protein